MNETYFLVEQAVFLTNLTRRSENGRNEAALLDASEGATRADLDATLDWATRVETFDGGYDPLNLFFFPTSSGSFAVGRLTPAVPEAGEGAFYFQTFFVDEDAFFQCGANPIALLHWALNTARFALYRPGANLAAFRLEARAPWIDREELRRTTARLGTRALTTLIQTVLEAKQATFVADCNAFQVVSTLFDLTPIHWRPSLSFAVGVRFRDDRSFRLIGATAKRGVDASWRGESDAPCCDLRDVVENDDAYPIENDWAALVELALKSNRVDYLYARMAEDFCLYQKNREDGRVASSDEIAELGLHWRLGLENEIRGEVAEDESDALDEESAFDDGRDAEEDDEEEGTGDASDESEFFSGEFEGGWRDSDGDERWRVDATDAPRETGPASNERAAPKFIYKVVEPTEAERAAEESDREKGREKNATRKKNDNKGKGNASEARRGVGASLDEIFAGESFEDEWAATKRKDGNEGETNDANDASGD